MIGPMGSLPGAQMANGMGDIAMRVAAIQERIDGLMPAAGFSIPEQPEAGGLPVDGADRADRPEAPFGTEVLAARTDARPAANPGGFVRGEELAARLPERGRALAPRIEAAAVRAGVEPALLAAVVQHESNFDQNVVSRAGAIGLAQLMPGTAAGLGVDPHDADQNLAGGARYLREQLERFGSVELALAAYNAGPNRVEQAGGVPRIQETMTYVDRVTRTWEQLR
ncbi:MAG: lytic transglycosylase domain-containing protein [Nitriliruptoraceae bacterium]|nr:lytic transglycosylase domain-containing protein [Nitriliruptoraceae bacterium]